MMYKDLKTDRFGGWESLEASLQGWDQEIREKVLDAVRNRVDYSHTEKVVDSEGNIREYSIRCWKGFGHEFFLAAGTAYRSASGQVTANFTDLDLEFVA